MKKFILLSLFFVLVLTGCKSGTKTLNAEEAKASALEFINNNLMQPGTQATIEDVVEEGSLYKLTVNIGNGQKVDSYLSKDGLKFFPQALDIKIDQEEENTADTSATPDVPKSDKPKVELFVMSHCPYGTQIEKGLLPVLDTLKDKVEFDLKFCSYAMHGQKELDEQMQQYCIQKEQEDKLTQYLQCFLQDGDSENCIKETKIDTKKLESCIAKTDKEYKVTEKYNDQSTWSGGRYPVFDVFKSDNEEYGVTGSPALVINGKKITSNRDSASLLKTICAAFNNAPKECDTELSSQSPSAGFGFEASGSNTSATCN